MVRRNLVSDSTLIDETLELVRAQGGRTSFLAVAESIFLLTNIDRELAASMVSQLLENDPRFVLEADHLAAAEDSNSALLRDLEFVVVDVEATHERRTPARIIEIGAYRVRGGEILDKFETLINPEAVVPRFLTNLTGISTEMLLTAPKFAEVADEWLDFIGDAVLVAHNANFDLPLLNREIARVFPGCRLRNAHLCTVDLARRLVPRVESHGLDALVAYFGFDVSRSEEHTSELQSRLHLVCSLLLEK